MVATTMDYSVSMDREETVEEEEGNQILTFSSAFFLYVRKNQFYTVVISRRKQAITALHTTSMRLLVRVGTMVAVQCNVW